MASEITALKDFLATQQKSNLDLKQTIKQKNLEIDDLSSEFYLSVIKILDRFESKEENLSDRYKDSKDALKVIKSYSSIKRQLLNLLQGYGVTLLEFPENKIIIGYSKVVETEPDSTKENDTIVEIIKNGYIKGEKLIREAELIVVKN